MHLRNGFANLCKLLFNRLFIVCLSIIVEFFDRAQDMKCKKIEIESILFASVYQTISILHL